MRNEVEIVGADAETGTRCGTCNGVGLMTCLHVGTGRDEDGWCTECDTPDDEPGSTTCSCQTC